jgi:hypothetical protein
VAVFRNANGEVAHSGIVRGTNAEGKVLIESKWGRLGRFVHTDDQHCYTDTVVTYYHTRRGGHLLRGLSGGDPDGEGAPNAAAAFLTTRTAVN